MILKDIVRKTYNARKKRLARSYGFKNRFGRKGGIVFIGDSIIEFLPVKHFFGKGFYNRGIMGETSDALLKRFSSSCIRLKPKTVFILIGTNDYHTSAEGKTADNIKEMLLTLKDKLPKAKVYVESLYPINAEILLPIFKREQAFIDKTNAEIAEMLKEFPEVTLLEIGKFLADENGALQKKFTNDGLHPNHKGYEVVRKILDEILIAELPFRTKKIKLPKNG